MLGPDSSYSSFVIHMLAKVEREERMDPPIQTEYFLSGGAMTLTFMVAENRKIQDRYLTKWQITRKGKNIHEPAGCYTF